VKKCSDFLVYFLHSRSFAPQRCTSTFLCEDPSLVRCDAKSPDDWSAVDAHPAEVGGGGANVQNTRTCCRFLRTGFRSSHRWLYYGSLSDLAVTQLMIMERWRGRGRLLSSGVPQTYAAGRLVPDVAKKNSTAFIVRGKAAQEDYLPLRSFGTPWTTHPTRQRHIHEHPNHQQHSCGMLEYRMFMCDKELVETSNWIPAETRRPDLSAISTVKTFVYASDHLSTNVSIIQLRSYQAFSIYVIHTTIYQSACQVSIFQQVHRA